MTAGRPGRVADLPLAAVLGVVVLGLVLVWVRHYRLGSAVIGAALLLGAALRLLLPLRQTGLLAVRSRGLDVLTMAAFGVLVVVLAVVIPHSNA